MEISACNYHTGEWGMLSQLCLSAVIMFLVCSDGTEWQPFSVRLFWLLRPFAVDSLILEILYWCASSFSVEIFIVIGSSLHWRVKRRMHLNFKLAEKYMMIQMIKYFCRYNNYMQRHKPHLTYFFFYFKYCSSNDQLNWKCLQSSDSWCSVSVWWCFLCNKRYLMCKNRQSLLFYHDVNCML